MRKILIIDDENDFCFFIKKNLEARGGFEVSVCSDAEEGINQANLLQPDLILLDILMPRISGPKIATELKNNIRTKNIPIVFLTAAIKPQEIENMKDFIRDGLVITKPVKINNLVNIINSLIKSK